jgi:hypothetical protein
MLFDRFLSSDDVLLKGAQEIERDKMKLTIIVLRTEKKRRKKTGIYHTIFRKKRGIN